jgi:hypothetical protein
MPNYQPLHRYQHFNTARYCMILYSISPYERARIAQFVWWLARDWMIQGSNPSWGEIFCTLLDTPWGTPSLLQNKYQVPFWGVRQPGCDVDHPPLSSAEVKERVELYLYSASGPSWSVLEWTLPFLSVLINHLHTHSHCGQTPLPRISYLFWSIRLACDVTRSHTPWPLPEGAHKGLRWLARIADKRRTLAANHTVHWLHNKKW